MKKNGVNTEKVSKLREEKFNLVHKDNMLLCDWESYKEYHKDKTPEEAEDYYYSLKLIESGMVESRFSLSYHSSLRKEMMLNRRERNKIAKRLKEIKKEMKECDHKFVRARKFKELGL